MPIQIEISSDTEDNYEDNSKDNTYTNSEYDSETEDIMEYINKDIIFPNDIKQDNFKGKNVYFLRSSVNERSISPVKENGPSVKGNNSLCKKRRRRQSPNVSREKKRKYMKEYNSRPEVIESRKQYYKEYYSRPEVIERRNKYQALKPKTKIMKRKYSLRPRSNKIIGR